MPNYSPEFIDFGFKEYNVKEISLSAAKQDGMHMGKLLMKNEILKIIKDKNPNPSKAIQSLIKEISEIPVEPYEPDLVR